MGETKYGVFYDLFPRSDLEFMREGILDPGDGKGSYSRRDKMLMLQMKAARKGDREAVIWLVKHLTAESKARMMMRKETQTIWFCEKPSFLSPAHALDVLDIAWLQILDVDLSKWLSLSSEDPDARCFNQRFPSEAGRWREIGNPICGHIEPWFLEAALARKQCPAHAKTQIDEWFAKCALQPLKQQTKGLPLNPLARDESRKTREECWFMPGQSGNPRGRPKGSKNKSKQVRRAFFDEMMTVMESGKRLRLTRRVAFLRRVEAKAIAEQDHEIMRLLLDRHIVMSKIQALVPYEKVRTRTISMSYINPLSLEGAIEALGGGALLYQRTSQPRMLLEPWVIEMGLEHLGERQLSTNEQRLVLMFTRHPRRTRWPDWWNPSLRARGSRDL